MGDTCTEPDVGTGVRPIAAEDPPTLAQLSVLDWPAVIVDGLAVKNVIDSGTAPARMVWL